MPSSFRFRHRKNRTAPHARIRQNLYLHRKACAQRDAQSIPATITVETIEPEAKTLELNGTPAPEPDLAAALRKEYAAKHSESRTLPRDEDIRLQKIIRPDYDVTLILQDEKAVAMYTPKTKETVELLQNDRYMELIPLPQENYFIIIDHPDGHISRLLLDKIGDLWNHEPNTPTCIFQTPGEYDVKWALIRWDWQTGTITVRRTENLPDIDCSDTMDFTIPIR